MQLSHGNIGIRRVAGIAVLVVVAWALMSVVFMNPASAQTDPYGNGGPEVESEVIGTGQGTDNSEVVGSDSSVLPFTGADLTLYLAIGLIAVGAGVWLVRRNRVREDGS